MTTLLNPTTNQELPYGIQRSKDGSSITIEVEVPGVNPKDIKIDIQSGTLMVECSRGSANIMIGPQVSLDTVKASVRWGMVIVQMPFQDLMPITTPTTTSVDSGQY